MATFPDLSNLSNSSGIGNLLALPNSSYPYYWAWILAGIWAIITFTLYFKEKEKIGKGRLLSSMSVACFAIMIIATIGSIVGFIELEIMIYTLVMSFVILGVWFFSK